MNKPLLYLTLHFKLTKKAIAAHITAYNNKLKLENPEGYAALKIKSPVEQTIEAVLVAYSKFLRNNEQKGLTSPLFKINRKALATLLNNRRSIATISRHLKAATRAGVLDSSMYVFHGSNSSFEVGFNPNLLVACQSEQYTNLLTEVYKRDVNNSPIPVNISVDMRAARPSFSDAFNGCMVSFCYNIVPVKTLLEQNINIQKVEIVDKSELAVPAAHEKNGCSVPSAWSFALVNNSGELPIAAAIDKSKNTEQEQGSWNQYSAKKVVDAAIKRLEAGIKQEQVPQPKIEKVAPNNTADTLRLYADISLSTALRVLFNNKKLDEYDIFDVQSKIRKYFNSRSSTQTIAQRYHDFLLAIYNQRNAVVQLGWVVAPIKKYFDEHFSAGFYNQLTIVEEKTKPYLATQPKVAAGIKLTFDLINDCIKNPQNFETYRKGAQMLGKKSQNTINLDFFNAAVAHQQPMDATSVQYLFTQNLNQQIQSRK